MVVGDIVKTKDKEQKKIVSAVVTLVERNFVNVMFADGNYGWRNQDKVKPTGRHIDMQSVLDSIK